MKKPSLVISSIGEIKTKKIEESIKKARSDAKKAKKRAQYYKKLLNTAMSHENEVVYKLAKQIKDAYNHTTSRSGLRIIHSILFNIHKFDRSINTGLKERVEITYEKLLAYIFAVDEKVGNDHM